MTNNIGRLLAHDDIASLVEELDDNIEKLDVVLAIYRDNAGDIYVLQAGSDDLLVHLGLLDMAKHTLLDDDDDV